LCAATTALTTNFAPAVQRAGLQFDVDVAELPQPTHIDVELWDRIVLNLLSNAVKYTPAGSVKVRLADAGGCAELVVTDTGVGIHPDDLPQVFDRFYRARNTGGRTREGCGIGLALVGELVKLLGGTVEVASELGVGSTFTVRVPYGHGDDSSCECVVAPVRHSEPAAAAVRHEITSDEPARSRSPRPRLLIADDNLDMRSYLQGLLGAEFDIVGVGDGDSALREARNHPPDLILADVMMPGTDGFELLAAVRSDAELTNVPVLLVSARAGEEATAEGLAAGADDYVVKPFSGPDLQARLRANLDRARARSRDSSWRAAMLSAVTEGVMIMAADRTILDLNEAMAAITGYGREGLPYTVPRPWAPDPATDPEHHELFRAAIESLVGNGGGTAEFPLRHRTGRLVWVNVNGTTVPDPSDGSQLLIATVRDVTRQRNFRARRDTATALAAEFVEQVDLAELEAAAVTGFGEIFDGEAILFRDQSEVTPDTYIDAAGTQPTDKIAERLYTAICAARHEPEPPSPLEHVPGLLIRATTPEQPHAVWIDFPAPRPVSSDERALAAMLGDLLATALDRAHRESGHLHTEEHLRRALDGQRTVAHAVGILMERHRITHQDAFDRLRMSSNERNIKLRELADRLVETGLES
jgi:PAS domain S-box-containing protein